MRKPTPQCRQSVGGVLCTQFLLQRRNSYARILGNGTGAPQSLLERRHAADGFQRILWGYEPPDLIEAEPSQGRTADVEMSGMRGIERAAENSDPARSKARLGPMVKAES